MLAAYETVRFLDGYQPPALDTLAAVGDIAELHLPAALTAGAMQTNAASEGAWAIDRVRLRYRTGTVSEEDGYVSWPGYERREVQLDGRRATVATFEAEKPSPHLAARNYHAMLLVPGDAARPGLFLLADCASPADCEVMLDALETLRFVGQ